MKGCIFAVSLLQPLCKGISYSKKSVTVGKKLLLILGRNELY